MDKYIIEGGRRLNGRIRVKGAKNAALPMLAAALLMDEGHTLTLHNVPDLSDIRVMLQLLEALGCTVQRDKETIFLTLADKRPTKAPYDIVSTMRASICVLGPLIARRGQANVSLPGGCAIGVRPVNLHLRGLETMGAEIRVDHGYIIAKAKRLHGGIVYLGGEFGSTVTGTANILMAATLARGTTEIEYAALEPEVQELARLLVRMGARIDGIGSYRLTVHGVDSLHGTEATVIPDRIEAGTFMAAAAITHGDVTVEHVRMEDMVAVVEVLKAMGCRVAYDSYNIRVRGPRRIKPVDVTTLPFPGFPTDLQSQFMACLAVADGISVVTEKIYPDRFMHVPELSRMGAQLRKQDAAAIIVGVKELHGAPVMASDLRAGAGLIVAGLAARGFTEISRIYHVDRGYDRLEKRLNGIGARIHRVAEKIVERRARKAE
jgi:UDP-N-acetylglucosamine 1-carboxyvinyltransferase